jgi:outer membrane protein OmpA-like peptidoglycan-associated protein
MRALLGAATALLLAGCASQAVVERAPALSERIILLPSETERPSAIVVTSGRDEVLLDSAYARIDIRGEKLVTGSTTADEVRRRYGALIAAQPKSPQPYTMYFSLGTDELTASSKRAFDDARKQIASWTAAEVVVIGHTDRLGTAEYNDMLSLQRAKMIARLLVLSGMSATDISVAARGEHDPIVPTADGIAEPRNRRVEIKVR